MQNVLAVPAGFAFVSVDRHGSRGVRDAKPSIIGGDAPITDAPGQSPSAFWNGVALIADHLRRKRASKHAED